MLKLLSEYINESVENWTKMQQVDKDYELKTKTEEEKNRVNVYKVGKFGTDDIEPHWNFTFGAEVKENKFVLYFFLDVEEEIIDSLIKEGYDYRPNYWLKEFEIEVSTFDEVKVFLDKHVWCYDPGYFY